MSNITFINDHCKTQAYRDFITQAIMTDDVAGTLIKQCGTSVIDWFA